MKVTVAELMQSPTMSLSRHQHAGHARDLMREKRVSALPVIDPDGTPTGIVTARDLLGDVADGAPVSTFMSTPVYTVHPGDGPHVAARIMRNHHLHHVVVVEGAEVVGILSTFDLLRLVEDHRYQARQAPTPSRRGPARS